MQTDTAYAFGRKTDLDFAVLEKRLREELQKEGFGVLTEIDVRDKFREKLGRDFRAYKILGACNPALAWEAFALELNIGTLLPCNVVLYDAEDGGTMVMAMDPVAALGVIGNAQLAQLAQQVRDKMERVIQSAVEQ